MSNLPLKSKYFYDGDPNPFKDVSKSIEILRKELLEATQVLSAFNKEKLIALKSNPKDSSKDYQEINKGLVELEKNNKLLVLIETKRIELEKAQEKLNQELLKTEQQLQKLQQEKNKVTKTELDNTIKSQKEKERLTKIHKKETDEINKSTQAYEKLSKEVKIALANYRNQAKQFGINSEQAKKAKIEYQNLAKQQNEITDSTKRSTGVWNVLKGTLGGVIGALGIGAGISGALSLAKGVMESTEGTADKFRETVSGLGGALGFMARALANMDFSNLIQGMKDAYAEGIRYEKGLDLAKDLKRSLDIQMKVIDGEQSAQKKIAKIKSNDITVRQAAIDEIIRLEEERLKKTKVFTELQLDNELKNAQEITKADKKTILELISNRDKYIDKLEEGAAIQKKIFDETTKVEQIQAGEGVTTSIIVDEKERLKLLSELTDEQRTLIDLSNLDKKLVGEKRDLIAAALGANIDADNALIFKEESLARLKNTLYNEYIKEGEASKKANEEKAKEVDKLDELLEKYFNLVAEKEALNKTDKEGRVEKEKEINAVGDEIEALIELSKKYTDLNKVIIEHKDTKQELLNANDAYLQKRLEQNKKEIDAEKEKQAALESINEGGYSSILDIFSKFIQRKTAIDENYSAKEIADQKENFDGKISATVELVDTLKSIYTDLLESRIDELQAEIDATNQKIDEQEQALNRESALQEQGAANNVNTEKKKLEELQKQRNKDLAEQKKIQKQKENVDKLTQISSLVTAIANIIAQYSDMGPVGWVLGLVAAAAAVVGYVTTTGDAKSAVGEDGELLTKTGTHIESGKRHSQGGNKYSMAEFEQGEAVSVFSRGATQRNFKDIQQFENLVNSGKWDLYKGSIGGQLNNIIVNSDQEQLLKEQRETNHLLRSRLTPVYKDGKLITFNINGVKVRSEN